jgi:hypothetical protein
MIGFRNSELIRIKPFYLLPEAFYTILFGGLIYIIFRTDALLMFRWFEYLQISDYIYSIRNSFSVPVPSAIKSFINTMPGGLWTFSYTVFLMFIWNLKINRRNILYYLIIPVAAVSSELFQLAGLIPGTFNNLDIISYLTGTALPFLIHRRKLNIKKI